MGSTHYVNYGGVSFHKLQDVSRSLKKGMMKKHIFEQTHQRLTPLRQYDFIACLMCAAVAFAQAWKSKPVK